jgi:hypothetical protein
MISIWVFLVCLAIPFLLGYDIVKIFNEWVHSKYEIMIQKREEGE